MWVDWDYNAPTICQKRPYGNSDIQQDICKILEWEKLGDDGYEPCYSSKQIILAQQIHEEMKTALQIVLNTSSFQPGLYEEKNYKWYRQI